MSRICGRSSTDGSSDELSVAAALLGDVDGAAVEAAGAGFRTRSAIVKLADSYVVQYVHKLCGVFYV